MKTAANQKGATLVELMIGLALSLIVTSSMVVLMGSSMGSATRIINMTQLNDEMRNTMSMVTRDVRRANYSSASLRCYANSDCGEVGDGSTVQSDVTIENAGSCLIFNVDRNQDNFGHINPDNVDEDLTKKNVFIDSDFELGGFRLTDDNGTGSVEMWVGDGSADCGVDDDDWIAATDPDFVDITTFSIVRNNTIPDLSVEGEAGATVSQRTNQLQIEMIGTLVSDATVTRRIVDTIKVRNDFIWRTPAAP